MSKFEYQYLDLWIKDKKRAIPVKIICQKWNIIYKLIILILPIEKNSKTFNHSKKVNVFTHPLCWGYTGNVNMPSTWYIVSFLNRISPLHFSVHVQSLANKLTNSGVKKCPQNMVS